MPHDLGTLRTQLLQLQQQLPALLETFLGRRPLLPGALYTLRRRCGKPNCRCARGKLHASTVLSYRGQGRPQNITPVQEVRRLLDQWQEPLRRQREWTEMRRSVKKSLRATKLRWAAELARVGLRLQGYEVRGWRKLRLRLSPSSSAASILRGRART